MLKYKNAILILIALVLFTYAAFISIIPYFVAKSVNKDKLQKDYLAATGLNISFDKAYLKIGPTFNTTITLNDLNIEFPDKQPVLKAEYAELDTTPEAIFGKTVVIKNLYLANVKYDDLILPDGKNKIEYLPSVIDPKYVGKEGLTIVSGPVDIRDIDISYTKTKPYSYKKEVKKEITMTSTELKEYLESLNFAHINIK